MITVAAPLCLPRRSAAKADRGVRGRWIGPEHLEGKLDQGGFAA